MNLIDPDDLRTNDSCLRYNVTARLLGRLERLAKSRFEIKKLTNEDIDEWRNVDDESQWEIAQSVNASSEIENEHIRADELSLVLAAVTGTENRVVTEELSARAAAVKSIYETYLWALTLDRKTYMDFDLVLEIHSRMFVTTKPEWAGRLKSKDVSIKGAGYDVKTLPPAKVATFMRALCESTNRRLLKARRHAEESMLLIIAEFILDFLAIHPFADGNGRTARLLSTYLLERAGYHFARFYPLDSIILENRDEYYRVLFESQKNWQTEDEDISPWVEFYVNAIYSQYIRAYQRVLDNFDHATSEPYQRTRRIEK